MLASGIPNLRFLDEAPVKEVDRKASRAWFEGGEKFEREVLKAHWESEQEMLRGHVLSLRRLQVNENTKASSPGPCVSLFEKQAASLPECLLIAGKTFPPCESIVEKE